MKFLPVTIALLAMTSFAHAQDSDIKAFQVTPSVNILNIPHPVGGSVEFVFDQFYSIKLTKSLEPVMTFDGNRAHFDDKSIAARIYPNRGSWFIGLAYGEHELHARRVENINTTLGSFDTNIYVDVKAQYLTPMTGWKWVSNSGFTLAMEFGWVFPSNGSSNVRSDQDNNPLVAANEDYRNARKDVEDFANDFANRGIPNVGLLELGWTF